MNIKLSGILAAGMLAMMALAPMGLAHDDSNVTGAGDGVNDTTVNMLSGKVVGAADPRLMLDFAEDSDLDDQDISFGSGLCDMEVASGGDDGTNERWVDGHDTGASNTIVPEGSWDDGGIGAVCHTTNMDGDAYDTWGCNYDDVLADDAVAGAVWVIAGCNWGYVTGGSTFDPTPFDGVDAFQNCVVNDAVLGFPADPAGVAVGCVDDLREYAEGYGVAGALLLVECVLGDLSPPNDCPEPSDGSFDCQTGHVNSASTVNGQGFEDTAAGMGDGSTVDVPSPEDSGHSGELPYDEGCDDEQGLASLFVYNSVVVDLTGAVPDVSGSAPATLVTVTTDAYV